MNEQRRVFLAVALCLLIAFVWQFLLAKRAPKPPPTPAPVAETETPKPAPTEPQQKAEPPSGTPGTLSEGQAPKEEARVFQTRSFSTDLFEGELTNTPSLSTFRLRHYTEQAEEGAPVAPVSLVTASFGEHTQQTLVRIDASNPPVFDFEGESGLSLVGKSEQLAARLTLTPQQGTYALDYVLRIENTGSGATDVGATVTLALAPSVNADEGSFLTPPADLLHGLCATEDEVLREQAGKIEAPIEQASPQWLGLDRQYFVVALVPGEPKAARCVIRGEDKKVLVDYVVPKESLAAGGVLERRFTVYLGPKRAQDLEKVAEPLKEVIDYNIWKIPLGFLARPMVKLLEVFHGFSGSWGLAIILLTVLVKLLLFPVTYKSVVSMRRMQLLKPELDKLKERYGNDRERMQMEQLKLFREKGVNPLGGCLPMLLQMPVWLSLYRSLWSDVDLYQQQFLWIDNLTAKEPFPFLALAFGALTVVQQKLTPTTMDSQQAKIMMYVMPVIFTFFMFPLPSGLVLYIVTNSILTILQQLVINRRQVAL